MIERGGGFVIAGRWAHLTVDCYRQLEVSKEMASFRNKANDGLYSTEVLIHRWEGQKDHAQPMPQQCLHEVSSLSMGEAVFCTWTMLSSSQEQQSKEQRHTCNEICWDLMDLGPVLRL
mmetsp:Transcript_63213/g.112797  ORF Transcript_63213/g.112797 Transcript_63213/m.112797 type:complete len:118 (-) Transcript_63213:111-464(-)